MTRQTATQTNQQASATSLLSRGGILQRKCEECGQHTIAGGECGECGKKKVGLQRKLTIGASNDPLELEADRVADQVMSAPANSAISHSSPRIQRFTGQASGQTDMVAPGSVDRVLSSPGRPLDPALRQDMGQRFGHDFSRVRIHTDGAAARSAQDVNANAYTVGHNIVFGDGQFEPGTHRGRRLVAHELTHVVQQSDSNEIQVGQNNEKWGLLPIGGGTSVSIRKSASLLLQRQQAKPSSTTNSSQRPTFFIPHTNQISDREMIEELIRLGIAKRDNLKFNMLITNGFHFMDERSFTTILALEIYKQIEGKEIFVGYEVTSYLQSPSQGSSPAQDPKPIPPVGATTPKKAPPKTTPAKPNPSKPVIDPSVASAQQQPTPNPRSADEMQIEFKALPESIKDLLQGGEALKPENLAQLLRIANRLKQLQPEELTLYKLLAKKLTADLDAFEQSVDYFIQFKAQIKAQADTEKTNQATNKELTLEEKLSKTWSQFDEKKFSGMDTSQKEALARDIAAQQRNIQLEHMATHPGETAVGMAEGIVRVDKAAKSIAEDIKDAANGDKNAYSRVASGIGAGNKTLSAVAGIVFVALLFVPGANLLELAAAGLAVAAASIVLSVAESELRIAAAGEAKTPEDFKTETAKSAAAQTQAIVAAAMIALTLAMKILAKIPLPGRYQNVGVALKAAQTALLERSGVGPAWQTVKSDVLGKLRSSKQGLPEALIEQSKGISETAKTVEGMSGDEFVKQLAAGDPKLADLGISSEQAKSIQQISSTAEGKTIPEKLRQDSLKALQDAPVEAGKKVDQFLKNVDDSIEKVEKAQSQDQLKSAVNDANTRLSAKEQALQAAKDEQAFVKDRLGSARRSGVREQAQKKLGALQTEKAQTQAEIVRLEKELSDIKIKVNQLKEKVLSSPKGSEARAKALAEFNVAKEALKELSEADELGGYRAERSKQNIAEDAILGSLELKRPSLWQATKDAIKKAAKKNTDGKFLDANTGEVIEGEPVYGHKYGRENRRLILEASEKGMTQEQFNQWVNEHPEWFQTETKANNESHRFEKSGTD
jgi:Domain of unknown function (DUF4157)/HNH/ENDO VII superfamily nuclease with conserved GHE residues